MCVFKEAINRNPTCPNCGADLELDSLPKVDCTEDMVSVETVYWCNHCQKEFALRTEGKVSEWSDTIIKEK